MSQDGVSWRSEPEDKEKAVNPGNKLSPNPSLLSPCRPGSLSADEQLTKEGCLMNLKYTHRETVGPGKGNKNAEMISAEKEFPAEDFKEKRNSQC